VTVADGFDLRVCTRAHAAVVAALQRACFDDAWSDDSIATLLSQPGVFGVLACNVVEEPAETELMPSGFPSSFPSGFPSGFPLGFVLCRVAADESEILSLGVLPEARRRGIGTELMEAAMVTASERGAARIFLEVAASNDQARALYGSLGFDERGRRTDYYENAGDKVDAIILAREL
jgi:ribosomal-protein-alanine N-acetyltransferase